MDRDRIRELLEQIRDGRVDPADALERLRLLPFEDLGFARVDHHRSLRQGWPEAIFSEGKSADEVARIARSIVDSGANLLATRLSPESFAVLEKSVDGVRYNERGRVAVKIVHEPEAPRSPNVRTVRRSGPMPRGPASVTIFCPAADVARSTPHDHTMFVRRSRSIVHHPIC